MVHKYSGYSCRKITSNQEVSLFARSVLLKNKGDATVNLRFKPDSFPLESGESLSFGDRENSNVNHTFNIEFVETGTKELYIISEKYEDKIINSLNL